MDIAQFRLDFPEFSSLVAYPDSLVIFWSGFAEKLTSQDVFGDCYTQAVALFTAHNLVTAGANTESASTGGSPGGSGGSVSSKSVGSASVSYDASSVMELGAGQWNQTSYGRMYYRLVLLFGQGCYQL